MNEAVVVLNGPEPEREPRIERALDLQDRYGIDLIASGGFTDEDLTGISTELSSRHQGDLVAERSSRETIGNALWSTTDIILPRDISHIKLVTSDYHIDRSNWLFSATNNGQIDIETSPVKTPYPESKVQELRQKERIFTAIGGVVLYKCDFTSPDGYNKAKNRVQFLFKNRYS